MQIIGITRFSFATIGGFQIQHDTLEDHIAYLYGKQRMEERFAYFEHLCLPALRRQTHPDFTLAVLACSEMPAQYLDRLKDLLADLPQARLFVRPPANHRAVMEEVIGQCKQENAEWIAHFRMDDDDAVALNFIEDVHDLFPRLRPMAELKQQLGLDYTNGYALRKGAKGLEINTRQKANWTPAQVIFLPASDTRTHVHLPHQKLNQLIPTVTMPQPLMFVRTQNGSNDSGDVFPKHFSPMEDEHRRKLKFRFGVNVKKFRQAIERL
ncbi:glycosyltransferase [Neptunicoccus cionae]|uniref:glycosyltransferase n=1 Tax=Neptunicoccus cionae TaxID=2035344 RepID=UPI000C781B3F|nr:glycosyltransferase [Amylibacter cionae]PLS19825.1 hypothetical protein C0U40_19820 [Amylibacter cionae]